MAERHSRTTSRAPTHASSVPVDKENIERKKKNETLQWRTEDPNERKPLSKGIAPKAFHGFDSTPSSRRRRSRPGQAAVQKLHSNVHDSLLKEERRKVGQQLELRRSAYKSVTSMRTWPLQARALRHWRELMQVHMHLDEPESQNEVSCTPTQSKSAGDSSSGSSSSSSSAFSVEEPKRLLRNLMLSPAKSQVKVQFRQEFLAEQALTKPLKVDHPFGDALWSMEPRVFSTEKSQTGKRKYIAGNLGRFMDQYWRKADCRHRHYYELIQEKTPCRLYLDLEFSKLSNDIADAVAEELLDEFFEELSEELVSVYQLPRLERSSVVDLDSSTDKKFSRHWIVHLPHQSLFVHTAAMGAFMQNFIGRLADQQATGQLQSKRHLLSKYLFVHVAPSDADPVPSKTTCFVDLGVYTRNRLFRLLGSSKFGKPASAALRIASSNRFPFPNGFGNHCFYLPAMEEHLRLQQNHELDDDIEEEVRKFVMATDWTLHAEALSQTLVVPMNASKIEFPILPYEEAEPDIDGPNVKKSGSLRRTKAASSVTYGFSPYPMLDDFVLKVLGTRGGIEGSIRAWSIDCDQEGVPVRITYQMSRNRWCECVGRAHKSNNIMWTVDLKLFHCIQSCHDPECRAMNFRGSPVDLHDEIRLALQDALFEEQLARIDEAELLKPQTHIPESSHGSTLLDNDDEFERALAMLKIDEDTGEIIDEQETPKLKPSTAAENLEFPDEFDKNKQTPVVHAIASCERLRATENEDRTEEDSESEDEMIDLVKLVLQRRKEREERDASSQVTPSSKRS